MAEDFQIQQGVNSQTTSPVYGLTGTVLGAGGTYYGLNKLTKPKYGSYEELLSEAKDSFDKKVQNATEENDKKFLNKVEEIRNDIKSANDSYKVKFDEIKAVNEGLTEKEIEAKVNEHFKVGSKAEYIKNQVKEKSEALTNDFGNFIKRKWGFEGNTKLKLAGAAVAGAFILGGLFNALAPKKQA